MCQAQTQNIEGGLPIIFGSIFPAKDQKGCRKARMIMVKHQAALILAFEEG